MKTFFTMMLIAIASLAANAQCGVGFQSMVSPSGNVDFFASVAVNDSAAYPITYTWSFGDGSSGTSSGSNISHQYGASGLYTVCVTIQTATGCTSNFCDIVNTNAQSGCYASYGYTVDTVNVVNDTYSFMDGSTPDNGATIISYNWSFGDSTYSTQQNPTHTFANPGTYWVCLNIATSSGCVSTSCGYLTVGNSGCQLYINLDSYSPSTIGGNDGYIESNVYGGTPPFAYTWSTGQTSANIYYLTSGIYTLNVVDANGCANSFTTQLYEPYDTLGGPIVDTLTASILDTCLNFVPANYYISNVTYDSIANTVTVVWIFEGSGMTSSLTVTYSYAYNGNNVVVISLSCGTKAISTYQTVISIGNALSIPEYGSEQGLFIYPVPFSNKLNVDFTSQKSENVNISIMDASGRLVLSKILNASTGVNNVEVNTSQLPSGVYILNIQNANGVVRKQIVK